VIPTLRLVTATLTPLLDEHGPHEKSLPSAIAEQIIAGCLAPEPIDRYTEELGERIVLADPS